MSVSTVKSASALAFASAIVLPLIAGPGFAASSNANGSYEVVDARVTAKDRARLKKVLKRHTYYGGFITRGMRAAAGDVTMPVKDNRRVYGDVYQCTYFTFSRGRRGLLCG